MDNLFVTRRNDMLWSVNSIEGIRRITGLEILFDEENFMMKDKHRAGFIDQQIELNIFGKYGER